MHAALLLSALLTIAAPRQEFKLTREEQAVIKALEPFGFKVEKLSWQVNGVELLPYGTVLAYNSRDAREPSAKDLAPLAKLTRLRRIFFYAEPIVNDTMLDLLRDMSHLHYLDLRKTRITDEGLKKLAGLKRLRFLKLDETEITDAGLKAFAEHPALFELSLEAIREVSFSVKFLNAKELRQLIANPEQSRAETLSLGHDRRTMASPPIPHPACQIRWAAPPG